MKIVIYRSEDEDNLDGIVLFVDERKGETLDDADKVAEESGGNEYYRAVVYDALLVNGDEFEIYTLHPYVG